MQRRNLLAGWLIAVTMLLALGRGEMAARSLGTVYVPFVARPGAEAPVIRSFTATPPTLAPGETSTLAWDVTGAAELTITPGIGSVTGTSIIVQPAASIAYTLTAVNAAGASFASVTVTVTDAQPGVQTGATWLPFKTNPDGSVVHTRGTNLAVDDQGGVHVAYAIRTGLDNGTRPAYYAYCPADCRREEQWTRVGLASADWVMDVRVALDPTGRPRLMIFSTPVGDSSVNHYTYAACNANCTVAGNWTLTPLLTANLTEVYRWDYAFRYFALDPTGHPAFFYTDGSQGVNHNGTFYATCLANPADKCSNAANWQEVKVSPYWLSKPSLAFGPQGQPRAAFFYYHESDTDVEMRLFYMECDAGCLNSDNWTWISMADMHGSSRHSLRVDGQGRPRLLFYSGDFPDQAFEADRLYYLSCNTDCTQAQGHDWQIRDLGLGKFHGQNADLALDGADRPRIAYDAFGGALSLAWCDTDCESAAVWQHKSLEQSATLEADYPVAPIRHCSISTWVTGEQPILELDASGNPAIGYVAEHGYGGKDLDEPWKVCPTYTDIILARFMQAARP
jgi:hypothetical protein